MAIREFKYKGYSIEELRQMDDSKLIEIVPSEVKRKMTRGIAPLDKRIEKAIIENNSTGPPKKAVRTHHRDILITPRMVGIKFSLYNGKSFENVEITPEMIFFKLGEFADTRKRPVHSKAGVGATKSSKNVGKK